MISFESALREVLKHARTKSTVRLPIAKALGCVLAERKRARDPIPLFDSSSVDGFAVRAQDVIRATQAAPAALAVQYTIRAGDAPGAPVKKGHAVKVLTGAPLPLRTSAVVMKEYVLEEDEMIRVVRSASREDGVRRQGREFAKGDVVFKPHTLVTPPVIGMLATLGCTTVKVYIRPRVSVIVTGNELRPPGGRLRAGEIRDSNSFAISAGLRAMGIEPVMIAHARDAESSVRQIINRALKRSDVVITVGGVSVGEFDYVKDVLAALGVKKIFWSVAMKPGKPNFFGTMGKKLVFGLPGNPVSALVSFALLVRPALWRMMGETRVAQNMKAVLTAELIKKPGRTDFVRGIFSWDNHEELVVTPTSGQESHMVGGIAAANGLIIAPREATRLAKGSLVDVIPLHW